MRLKFKKNVKLPPQSYILKKESTLIDTPKQPPVGLLLTRWMGRISRSTFLTALSLNKPFTIFSGDLTLATKRRQMFSVRLRSGALNRLTAFTLTWWLLPCNKTPRLGHLTNSSQQILSVAYSVLPIYQFINLLYICTPLLIFSSLKLKILLNILKIIHILCYYKLNKSTLYFLNYIQCLFKILLDKTLLPQLFSSLVENRCLQLLTSLCDS